MRNSAKKRKNGLSLDRLSDLPDSVLLHILSFLPTKYAVGTSILSSRWRYLFNSLSSFDFDDSLFLHRSPSIKIPEDMRDIFMNFVHRELLLRKKSCLDKLRLRFDWWLKSPDANSDSLAASRHLNAWLCGAILHGVRELDLEIKNGDFGFLPANLFSCNTLVVLKLQFHFVVDIPSKVCLPNLKILHLYGVVFYDNKSISRLFSSCPVLEDLVIYDCQWEDPCKLNLSSSSLKRLTIVGFDWFDELLVNAPSLIYFELNSHAIERSSLVNLNSLVEGNITRFELEPESPDNVDHCSKAATQFFRAISSVRSLHLCGYAMEALYLCVGPLPVFRNMTRVEAGAPAGLGKEVLEACSKILHVLRTLSWRHE